MTDTNPRVPWSEDEARVLVAIYFAASFSIGDDARDECRLIADAFGRTPSSVDRQWRNVQAVVQANASYNIGKIIKESVAAYLDNPKAMRQIAIQISRAREWELEALIQDGSMSETAKVHQQSATQKSPSVQLTKQLGEVVNRMTTKVFKSGALGFFAQGKVHDELGDQYQAQFSIVLIGSKNMEEPDLVASTRTMVDVVKSNISQLQPKRFSSGRTGYFGNTKFEIDRERFQATMQVVHIRGTAE
jgi:hypothetical protein